MIYWISKIGLTSVADWLIMLAFLSMAILSFYFGTKAWWWNKNKKGANQSTHSITSSAGSE